MLSLICSCFYPEPRNINTYTYDGESDNRTPLQARSFWKAWVLQFLSPAAKIIKSVFGRSHY